MGHLITLLSPKKIIVQDSFNRADNASSLGNANTGQGWQILEGTFGIESNFAKMVTSGGANRDVAVINSGVSNCLVGISMAVFANSARLAFRFSDVDNGFLVIAEAAAYKLFRRQAGVYTQIGSSSLAPASGDNVRVQLIGSSIQLIVNGAIITTTSDSFNQTATRHGIGGYSNQLNIRYDNFIVEVV